MTDSVTNKIILSADSTCDLDQELKERYHVHYFPLHIILDGKDYYIITSLPGEDADRLGFSVCHMAVPHSVSFTEEAWKHYTLWLSCTLNRNTVLLELGENYKDPSLIRWPFEKTAMLNNKAYLFRVHKIFSQVPEELSGKSCPLAEVSFKLVDDFLERV